MDTSNSNPTCPGVSCEPLRLHPAKTPRCSRMPMSKTVFELLFKRQTFLIVLPVHTTSSATTMNVNVDLLDVGAMQAVYVDKNGQKHRTECISVDFGCLALETPATVRERAQALSRDAHARFDAALQKISQDEKYAVKGLPDEYVSAKDVFAMTFGRVITSCAVGLLRNKDFSEVSCSEVGFSEVGKIVAPALHCKGGNACITILCVATEKVSSTQRGPSLDILTPQVRISRTPASGLASQERLSFPFDHAHLYIRSSLSACPCVAATFHEGSQRVHKQLADARAAA
jgi:hypothetical protein